MISTILRSRVTPEGASNPLQRVVRAPTSCGLVQDNPPLVDRSTIFSNRYLPTATTSSEDDQTAARMLYPLSPGIEQKCNTFRLYSDQTKGINRTEV